MRLSEIFKLSFIILVFALSFLVMAEDSRAEDVIEVQTYSTTSDFRISSNFKTFSVCECSTFVQKLTVSNPSSNPVTVKLGSDSDYVMFDRQSVSLAPSDSKQVTAYVEAPCDAPSEDTIAIKGTSSSGKTKAFTQKVTFSNCQNLKAGIEDRYVNASVCEPFRTTLYVKNTGSFRETYSIDVLDFEDNIHLSASKVTLDPGVQQNISVEYDLPCSVYGEHEIGYMVKAKRNERQAALYQTLNIPREYDYQLYLPERMPACQEGSLDKDYQFILVNNNDFTDTFKLTSSTPSFADAGFRSLDWLFPEKVTLDAGESFVKNISLSDLESVDENNHTISFNVESVNGETSKSISRQIRVSDCHDGTLRLPDTPEDHYVCAGDTFSDNVIVSNTGSRETYYELLPKAPDFMTFSDGEFLLDSGKPKSVSLDHTVPTDRNYEYPIDIFLYANGEKVDESSHDLIVDSSYDCFGISVKGSSQDILYHEDGISLSIRNDGTRKNTYTMEFTNSSLPLDIEPQTVTVAKDGETPFTIELDKTRLLDDTETENDLIGTVLEGELQVTHTDTGFTQTVPVTIEIEDESAWSKAWSFLASLSVCTIIFSILALAFIVSLIPLIVRLASPRMGFSPRYNVLRLGLAVVILAFLVVSLFQGLPSESTFYTQHNLTSDDLNHVLIEEDGSKRLEYDEYFFDPDYNIETYGVDGVNESILSFTVNESEVALYPAEDWHGNTTIELFVVDEYNETARSGVIDVEVLPVEDHTVMSFFRAGCPYFSIVVLLLIALSLFFTLSMQRKRQAGRPAVNRTSKKYGDGRTAAFFASLSQKSPKKSGSSSKDAASKKKGTKKDTKKNTTKSDKKDTASSKKGTAKKAGGKTAGTAKSTKKRSNKNIFKKTAASKNKTSKGTPKKKTPKRTSKKTLEKKTAPKKKTASKKSRKTKKTSTKTSSKAKGSGRPSKKKTAKKSAGSSSIKKRKEPGRPPKRS